MSWTARSLRFAFLPLFSLSIAAGCGNDEQTGNLSVNYDLGFTDSCTLFEVPIETVRVTVGNGLATEEAPCQPGEPIIVDSIKAGTYDLLVEAIDAENFVVMDNLALPETDDRAEVHGGSSTDIDVDLTATPAVLRFRWVISIDDFPSSCAQVATKFFNITAFENGGSGQLYGPHEFECELPEPSYNAVPDPNRQINGSDLDAVAVEIQDAQHNEIDTVQFTFEPPGPGRVLDFDITCNGPVDAPTCDGTVNLPPGTSTSATEGGSAESESGDPDTGSTG